MNDSKSEPDLFAALAAGKIETISSTAQADPSRAADVRSDGVSLLMACLYHRQPELAELLAGLRTELEPWEAAALGRRLAIPSDLAACRSPDGFSLLHLAAFFARLDTMRTLLTAGADVDAVAANPSRVRPLHSAAAARSTEACRLLLERSAKVDVQQAGGYTALMAACQSRNAELARMLVTAGANPELRAEDGRSARAFLPEDEDPAEYGLGG